MRQGSQRSANTGAPSWLSRPPPEIRKLDQPELLDFCGGRITLDRSFLGLFDELLESGVFANLFVYPVLVTFAHAWRVKHRKAKRASTPSLVSVWLECGDAKIRNCQNFVTPGVIETTCRPGPRCCAARVEVLQIWILVCRFCADIGAAFSHFAL
jgi:hypothetical protein